MKLCLDDTIYIAIALIPEEGDNLVAHVVDTAMEAEGLITSVRCLQWLKSHPDTIKIIVQPHQVFDNVEFKYMKS
jgi:hypothetical protein